MCGFTSQRNERTNPLSALPTLSSNVDFFLRRELDSVNTGNFFPPYINIVVDVYSGEKDHSISARKQIRRSREKRGRRVLRSCFFTVFGSTRRFFVRISHGYGDTFPRVSTDFRQESVDRGREENITKRKIELTDCAQLWLDKSLFTFFSECQRDRGKRLSGSIRGEISSRA